MRETGEFFGRRERSHTRRYDFFRRIWDAVERLCVFTPASEEFVSSIRSESKTEKPFEKVVASLGIERGNRNLRRSSMDEDNIGRGKKSLEGGGSHLIVVSVASKTSWERLFRRRSRVDESNSAVVPAEGSLHTYLGTPRKVVYPR